VLRAALLRFLLLTLVAFGLVAAGTALASRAIAEDEAVRDARHRTESVAARVAGPLVDGGLRERRPRSIEAMSKVLGTHMSDGSLIHIVVYEVDGRVLWSEDPELVGKQQELPCNVEAAVSAGRGSLATDVAGHPLTGTADERDEESLIEVYVGSIDAEGEPFVLEAYTPRAAVQADAREIFQRLVPVTLGSLFLLELAVLPLALRLARRIDRSAHQRASMLRRALLSWHVERERMAQELHDDVIQDLSAMSYALPAVLEPLPTDPPGETARATGQRMNDLLISSLDSLRSLLNELVPLGFDGEDLENALQSLARSTGHRGVEVVLTIEPDLGVGHSAGGLAYRVVREGLRNVVKHAEAATATVTVARRRSDVVVTIVDDGRGIGDGGGRSGHVGLQLLSRFLEDVGGTLSLEDVAGGGARLVAVLPAQLPELDDDLGH
jgi:signal transduction histidine kinase